MVCSRLGLGFSKIPSNLNAKSASISNISRHNSNISIPASKTSDQLPGIDFLGKGTDLHAKGPDGASMPLIADDLQFDLKSPGSQHSESLCRGIRDIDDPIFDKGTPVIDA